MTVFAKLIDTGTNEYIHFTNVAHSGALAGVPAGVSLVIEEDSIEMAPPEKNQVFGEDTPFRHGTDLVLSSYKNREVRFTFTISHATDTEYINDTLVALNRFFERARQYSLLPVRRGMTFVMKLHDKGEELTFDVIDGSVTLPSTFVNKGNFVSFGSEYRLYNVQMTMTCKPFARGAFQRLLTSAEDGFKNIYVWDSSASAFLGTGANYSLQPTFNVLPTDAAANDYVVFGSSDVFYGIMLNVTTIAAYTTLSLKWEYWSGAAWTEFTPSKDTSAGFKKYGWVELDWNPNDLVGWASSTLNSVAAFYVRCRVVSVTGLSAQPVATGPYEMLNGTPTIYNNDEALNYIWVYDASPTSYGTVNYASHDYFALFPTTPAAGDCLYMGADVKFFGGRFTLDPGATYTSATLVWEYWTGAAWSALTIESDTTGYFKNSGRAAIRWLASSVTTWARTVVNGINGWWVRCRVSAATAWTVSPQQNGDTVHRNRDAKIYIRKESIAGDAPSPLVTIIKSQRALVATPTTALKVSGMNRYRINRIQSFYEAETQLGAYTYTAWGDTPRRSSDSSASGDACIYWSPTGATATRVIAWPLSWSTGMARDRWGNYVMSIRYKDNGVGNTMRAKIRAYVYRDTNDNIYGEEGRWYNLPAPKSSGVAVWTTVDIGMFPIPPANISMQTGYYVVVDLLLQRTSGTESFYLDGMVITPTDQYSASMRTKSSIWNIDPADSTRKSYVFLDAEAENAVICDTNVPSEDPNTTGSAVAFAGFDEYYSGKLPWIHPGHDFMLGLQSKNGLTNRFDINDDSLVAELWYAPRYLLVGD